MNKRDLSVSMQRANSTALYIGIPVVVFQFTIFSGLHNGENLETTGSFLVFLAFVLAGVVVHEFIHGLTWMAFGDHGIAAHQGRGQLAGEDRDREIPRADAENRAARCERMAVRAEQRLRLRGVIPAEIDEIGRAHV